jgi:uncharacterized protein YdaU (DUF1376 family)
MNPFLLESFFLLDGEFWVKLNGKEKREKRKEKREKKKGKLEKRREGENGEREGEGEGVGFLL